MVSGDNVVFESSLDDSTSSFTPDGVDDEVEDIPNDSDDGGLRRRCGVAFPANDEDRLAAAAGASRGGMRNDEEIPAFHPARTTWTMKIDATARRRHRGRVVVGDGRRRRWDILREYDKVDRILLKSSTWTARRRSDRGSKK